MMTKKVDCNRLVIRNGKYIVVDVFGNQYTRFKLQSRPIQTEVIVSENQIVKPKKKKKKRRFFGR